MSGEAAGAATGGGPKLPYFHRTLSAEDAALVGDVTPKPIGDTTGRVARQNTFSGAPPAGAGSAWNAAGSWEERDTTAKCTELMDTVMDGDFVDLAPGVLILSCTDAKGTSSLVHSKGKARYLYSFTLRLKAEVAASNGKTYELTLVVEDVGNDQPAEDYDLAIEWGAGGSPPSAALGAAKAAVLSSQTRRALRAKLQAFEAAYRAAFPSAP